MGVLTVSKGWESLRLGEAPEAALGLGAGSGNSSAPLSWGKQEPDVYLWRQESWSGTLSHQARVQPFTVGRRDAICLDAGSSRTVPRFAEGSESLLLFPATLWS